MKTLAITFSIALSIIISAITYKSIDPATLLAAEELKAEKTIIEHDANGRTVTELTMQAFGKIWLEVGKKQTSYTGNHVETVCFNKENGEWVESTKIEATLDACGNLKEKSLYVKSDNGGWERSYAQNLDDLSADSEIVDDMLFDKDGNLVMLATYKWVGSEKDGIMKEEYEYAGNERNRVVSYRWTGNDWSKTAMCNVVMK